jgi:hypothetical protein
VSTHRAEAADQADVPDGMSIPDSDDVYVIVRW